MKSESKALGFGLAAVLCWSTVATAFKIALSHQSILQLIAIATLSSTLFLALVLAKQGRLILALSSLSEHWKIALFCGLLNPLLYYMVLLLAYEILPAQVVQPINYTWAIVLSFLAIPFLGQRLRRLDVVALAICYSGIVVISLGAGSEAQGATMQGILLAILSTFIWAGYWIVNSRDQRPPTMALFQNFVVALPIILVISFPWNLSIKALASSAYIGLFEMGLAFWLWLNAMRSTSNTSKISNLIFLSPIISLVLIYFILGEAIHPHTYLGLALILIGIAVQNRAPKTPV